MDTISLTAVGTAVILVIIVVLAAGVIGLRTLRRRGKP